MSGRNTRRLGVIDGVRGKECNECNEWKSLEMFYKQKQGLGGKSPKCKNCISYKSRRNTEFARNRVTWSKEVVVLEIRKAHSAGKPLNANYYYKYEHKLYGAAFRYFGGWLQAIESSGISLKDIKTESNIEPWSKEKIIDIILAINLKGNSLKLSHIRRNNPKLYTQHYRYFPDWKTALMEAGIDPEGLVQGQKINYWTEDTLTKEIKDFYETHGDLSYSFVSHKKRSDILGASIQLENTWRNAVEKAGFNYLEVTHNSHNSPIFGFEFERVLRDILAEIGVDFEFQKEVGDKLRPDFSIKNSILIDAKLSEWTISNCDTIEKYEPHCRMLNIIYLRGDRSKDSMITKKTRLMSVYKLVKQLPQYRQDYFNNVLGEIESRAGIADKEKRKVSGF